MRLEDEAAAASPRRAALIRYELGRLLASRAEDRARALEVFQQGAEFAPAARAVTRLHVHGGEAALLIPALEAEERAAGDAETRAAILVERALVRLTEVGDGEQAHEELLLALELDPGQAVALEALSERLIEAGRAEELEELLREQADACGDEIKGAELLFRAARVREQDLDDAEQALALYRAAAQADPDHEGAGLSALRLQRKAGAWPEVAAGMQALAGRRQGDAAASLLQQAARVHLERLDSPDLALACLKRAIQRADKGARGPLLLEAAGLLETMGRDAEAAAAFTEARLAAGSDAQAARALYGLGGLQLNRLGQPKQGFQSLGTALELDPALEPARLLLRDAAWNRGEHQVLAAHFAAEVCRGGSAGWRAGLRLGQLLEDQLDDPAGAVEAYQQTLALRPGWRPALVGLARAQHAAGEPALALAALEAQLLSLVLPEEKIRVLEQVAELAEHELGDLAMAASAHERILSLDPGWQVSRARLVRLYEALGRWTHLASLLRASVERTDDDDNNRTRLLDHLAWVYTCRLNDPDAALEAHQHLLKLCPDYLPALQGAARILGASGRGGARLEVLRRLEETSGEAHPGVLATLHQAWNLGYTMGQWGEAAGLALKLKERLEERLEEDSARDPAARHLAGLVADLLWACHLRHDPDGALIQALQDLGSPEDPADAASYHRRLARGLGAVSREGDPDDTWPAPWPWSRGPRPPAAPWPCSPPSRVTQTGWLSTLKRARPRCRPARTRTRCCTGCSGSRPAGEETRTRPSPCWTGSRWGPGARPMASSWSFICPDSRRGRAWFPAWAASTRARARMSPPWRRCSPQTRWWQPPSPTGTWRIWRLPRTWPSAYSRGSHTVMGTHTMKRRWRSWSVTTAPRPTSLA